MLLYPNDKRRSGAGRSGAEKFSQRLQVLHEIRPHQQMRAIIGSLPTDLDFDRLYALQTRDFIVRLAELRFLRVQPEKLAQRLARDFLHFEKQAEEFRAEMMRQSVPPPVSTAAEALTLLYSFFFFSKGGTRLLLGRWLASCAT